MKQQLHHRAGTIADRTFVLLKKGYRAMRSCQRGLMLIVFMILAAMNTSCSSNGIKGIAEPPTVMVEGVNIDHMSILGGKATVALNVSNPNTYPLPLNGFDYGLKLNGIKVAGGSEKGNLTVDGRGNRLLHIPVELSLLELIRFAPQLLSKKSLTYELAGAAHFPLVKVPFKRTGGVTRSQK